MNKINYTFLLLGMGLFLASCSSQNSSIISGSISLDSNSDSSASESASTSEWGEFSLTSETGAANISVSGNVYTIINSVDDTEYVASGELLEGKIIFADTSTQSAILRLNNVHITNTTESPIQWLASSKKAKIKTVENTNNIIESGVSGGDAVKSIVSNNNLDVGGAGQLSIISSGTAVNATTITIEDSIELSIESQKYAFSAKELVFGDDPSVDTFIVDIKATEVGLRAELNSSSKKGTIVFNNAGSVTVHDCATGVYAEGSVTVSAGTLVVKDCTAGYSIPTGTFVIATGASVTINGETKDPGTY